MMRLRELFADDDAVSPVIGVILMVAITVILAAVIASFVLGLGSQTETTPQASFSVDYSESGPVVYGAGNVTVTHDSGDPILESELYLRGDNITEVDGDPNSWENYRDSGSFTNNGGTSEPSASSSGETEGETAVVAGDRLTIGAGSDYELSVVYEAEEGGSSSTLATDSGPAA